MFCIKCGHEIGEGEFFCVNCGTRAEQDSQEGYSAGDEKKGMVGETGQAALSDGQISGFVGGMAVMSRFKELDRKKKIRSGIAVAAVLAIIVSFIVFMVINPLNPDKKDGLKLTAIVI